MDLYECGFFCKIFLPHLLQQKKGGNINVDIFYRFIIRMPIAVKLNKYEHSTFIPTLVLKMLK